MCVWASARAISLLEPIYVYYEPAQIITSLLMTSFYFYFSFLFVAVVSSAAALSSSPLLLIFQMVSPHH
jgi:hypothetical protein